MAIKGFTIGTKASMAAIQFAKQAVDEGIRVSASVLNKGRGFFERARIEDRGWQAAETALKLMENSQAKNLTRFIDKIPKNSENIRVRDFLDGGKVFQADSPAANIPGSFARYEKQVDSSGKTILFTKTTYGPNGQIIDVAPKFPPGSKIYPYPDMKPQPSLK